jgi:hypothetical protein
MGKKVWWHPFEPNAIKRKLCKNHRKPSAATHSLNPLPTVGKAEGTSKMHQWKRVFDDPDLHQALDRIMANNGIA